MHRLDIGVYTGQPGETAALTTLVGGSGWVVVRVDGNDIGPARTFQLKPNAGDQTQVQVALFGATGETCVAGIAIVDGATDGDLLVCQPHDPAPIHTFRFIVAA